MRTRKGGVVTSLQQIEINKQKAEIKRKIYERKMAMQTREITDDEDDEDYEVKGETISEQTDRVLNGSIFTFLQRGTYGGVFSAKYNDKLGKSGFFDFETKTPVNDFIVKVQAIDFEMSFPEHKEIAELGRETTKISLQKLRKEVTLQNALVEKALIHNLLPPCPSILSYKIVDLRQLDSYVKGQIVFEDEGVKIEPMDYSRHSAAIVIMEFVSAPDIISIQQKTPDIYLSKFQEIRNKTFRAYCTALSLGVDQRDVKTSNYLFSEDGRITMIDFGEAVPTTPEMLKLVSFYNKEKFDVYLKHQPKIVELIDKAEKGNFKILRKVLSQHPELDKLINEKEEGNYEKIIELLKAEHPKLYKMIKTHGGLEGKNYRELREYLCDYNEILEDWLLDDEYGFTVFEPVKPISLNEDIAQECRSGLCELTVPIERPRKASVLERPKESVKRQVESEERSAKRPNVNNDIQPTWNPITAWGNLFVKTDPFKHGLGGKRHTKYVGSRKRFGTRRKVQNRSF
jgi:serine/threonine protein kinase